MFHIITIILATLGSTVLIIPIIIITLFSVVGMLDINNKFGIQVSLRGHPHVLTKTESMVIFGVCCLLLSGYVAFLGALFT